MKVIIAGGGKVGTYLATLLLLNGHEVKVLENNEKYYTKVKEDLPDGTVSKGNASDPQILEEAGIASADVLAAVSDEDEKNLVVSTLAKLEFAVPKVIARVNNPQNAWLFDSEMGVDVGVNQADIMAHLILEEMNVENMLTLMKLNRGEYSIVQINVKESAWAVSRPLKDLGVPINAVMISITREGAVIIPRGDSTILSGDELLMLTDEGSRKKLGEIFG